MNTLDMIIYSGIAAMAVAFIYIIWSYARHLKQSPREIYLLFFTKLTEYSAYGAMNLAFVLFLSSDVGMGDISAGTYIGIWSMFITVTLMMIGPVCDAIGVRKTLLAGTIVLLISRFLLPLSSNIIFVSLFAFIPMAIGMAVMGPVLSVGIKRFTTKDTAALGFGLFYTIMNVGWAVGAWLFDAIRGYFGEHEIITVPFINWDFSTYQIIFTLGFIFTLPDLIAVLLMRDGVDLTDDGEITIEPPAKKQEGTFFEVAAKVGKDAAQKTIKIFKEVYKQKSFRYFILMVGILVFVRFTFYHWHYTFPKYGIRVFGEGLPIGSIFGVLNPVMIVFLTPLVATLTRKVSSYKMLIIGATISAVSVFIAAMPEVWFAPMVDTWFGELIMDRWLAIPLDQQRPLFISIVLLVMAFTVGEAIWSPRLMQFMAEIAPKGKEGTYISLSYLPYFLAKLFVGPLSGILLAAYVPEGQDSYPNHYMIWIWIGAMSLISPLGLFVFRKVFTSTNSGEDEEETVPAS